MVGQILLALVCLYAAVGAFVFAIALYWMVGTQDKYPAHAGIVGEFKNGTAFYKAHALICAFVYCVVFWLPIATGHMKRPVRFLG